MPHMILVDLVLSDYVVYLSLPRSVRWASLAFHMGKAGSRFPDLVHGRSGLWNLSDRKRLSNAESRAHQVGGRDEDPFKILQFFQMDTHGIFRLCQR